MSLFNLSNNHYAVSLLNLLFTWVFFNALLVLDNGVCVFVCTCKYTAREGERSPQTSDRKWSVSRNICHLGPKGRHNGLPLATPSLYNRR